MSYNTAMAALEEQIGLPPTKVDSTNRGLVRKWLRAAGVSSKQVEKMTTQQLADAYNGQPGQLAALIEFANEQDESETPSPSVVRKPSAPAAGLDPAMLAQVIGAALAAIPQPAVEIDEARIVELIQQHAGKPSVSVIEVRDSEGVLTRLEGLHHKAQPVVTKMLAAGVHVWLAGPAGSGKTTIAETAASALERPFYSTGAVQSEYKLTGFVDAEGRTVRTPFREAYEHGGLFLWDEIDASAPGALVAFNQALANGCYAFPDGMIDRHPGFIAVAAANTWGTGATAEYVGRNRIDAATLDRFATVQIDYDEDLEKALVGPKFAAWVGKVQRFRKAAGKLGLRHIISPRASINGAKMLAAGLDDATVIASLIRRGLDDASWSKLEQAA